ncbi:hypothetical protein HDV00_004396 [Rhizophlyctis rosea]|nr:hypothetical protein HDV00_004396 [Rhizophlyctis rosea]
MESTKRRIEDDGSRVGDEPVKRRAMKCGQCGELGHRKGSKKCSALPVDGGKRPAIRCGVCGELGHRKGSTKCFGLHLANRKPAPHVPVEIWEQICERVPSPVDIVALSGVNRVLALALSNTNAIFWKKWTARHGTADLLEHADKWGIRRSLKLLGEIGCELCGKPRIRKIYPYGVRCYKACLRKNTICEHYLPERLHGIDLPYNEKKFPGRSWYGGGFTARFYWVSQLERYIREEYGFDSYNEFKVAEDARVVAARKSEELERRRVASLKRKVVEAACESIVEGSVFTRVEATARVEAAAGRKQTWLPEDAQEVDLQHEVQCVLQKLIKDERKYVQDHYGLRVSSGEADTGCPRCPSTSTMGGDLLVIHFLDVHSEDIVTESALSVRRAQEMERQRQLALAHAVRRRQRETREAVVTLFHTNTESGGPLEITPRLRSLLVASPSLLKDQIGNCLGQ